MFVTVQVRSQDEFIEMQKRKMAGDDTPYEFKGMIKDVPDNFKEWVRKNESRIEKARAQGTEPYFVRDNEKWVENILKDNTTFAGFNEEIENLEDKKQRRKDLLVWAKENLITKEVYHNELSNNINFSVRGIKEFLNQPHEFYYEKNEMIKDIQNIIKGSKYMGIVHFKERVSHIFEIEISKKNSWLIANERGGVITLYSISDSANVLTGIKK